MLSSNEDLLELLGELLERAGFEVGTARLQELAREELDVGALLQGFDPQVVVFELALPYVRSAALLAQLRALPEARGRGFVSVSANARAVEPHAGPGVLELQLAPADLALLLQRVGEAVRHPQGRTDSDAAAS